MIVRKILHRIRTTVADVEISLLKSIAKRVGYEVKPKEPLKISEVVIDNFFRTKYKKHALLSYIVYPFIDKIDNSHSNNIECYLIAEVLKELGYNVDIINWNNEEFRPVKTYSIVIDNHNNLERFRSFFSNDVVKIFHATNAHWLYQNKVEFERHYEYYLKTGTAITPTRSLTPGNSVAYCDAISMLGNIFTKTTFGQYEDKVFRVPISVTTNSDNLATLKVSERKKNFLWFNSAGFLLKGLDIVLDTFINLPNCTLYVCGNFEREAQFLNSYNEKLKECTNIKMIGWVDVESVSFLHLIESCAWVINTSFSEGGGGSTLNCMAKGLIPIASRSASIDIVEKETGFILEQNSSASLTQLINTLIDLPDEVIETCSKNAAGYTSNFHSKDNFKESYIRFLRGVIKPDVAA